MRGRIHSTLIALAVAAALPASPRAQDHSAESTPYVADSATVPDATPKAPIPVNVPTAATWRQPEIGYLPTRGLADIVALQPGTVRRAYGGSIYIRGSASNQTACYVDGIPLQDPFTGEPITYLSNGAIGIVSVLTGGQSARYGLATSGLINVTTLEGRDGVHGSLEASTDNFHGERSDYNLYSLALRGSLLPRSDKLTFSLAGERNTLGRPRPGGPGVWSRLSSWNGKLSWRASDDLRIGLGTLGSYRDGKESIRAYLFDSDHAPRHIDETGSWWGTLTHDLSPKTAYTLSAAWSSISRRAGDGVYFDNLWGYGRPYGNPTSDATQLFWSWDDISLDPDSLAQGHYVPMRTPIVDSVFTIHLPGGDSAQHSFVVRGDERHLWDDYYHQDGSYIGSRFDLTSRIHADDVLGIGLEFQRHTVRLYANHRPSRIWMGNGGGLDEVESYGFDSFARETSDGGLDGAKHPVTLGGYVQNRMSWKALTLSVGLRVDDFDWNTKVLPDPRNPLDPFNHDRALAESPDLPPHVRDSLLTEAQRLTASDLADSKSIMRLSPRLGASLGVGNRSSLHASYGRYVERIPFEKLFVSYRYMQYIVISGAGSPPFGNPDLKPEETSISDIGWQQKIADIGDLDVTAFYKDIRNIASVALQPATPGSYRTYESRDHGTAEGVELRCDLRAAGWLSSTLRYLLQETRASGSLLSNVGWTGSSPEPFAAPRNFDRRHTFVADVDLRTGAGGGPKLGTTHPLQRAGVNILFVSGSGFPYTPTKAYNEVTLGLTGAEPDGPVNSKRTPAVYRLDLKARKDVPLRRATLNFYLWVINVFNRRNVLDVYSSSGQPANTGWLETREGQAFSERLPAPHDVSLLNAEQKYRLREDDPGNFDIPRQIRAGIALVF